MASPHSFSTRALVLKRYNVGEMDRLLTLLTPEKGKLKCVAKGVRKMTSSQRAYLEPGNLVDILLIETKSTPILTQTRLVDDFASAKVNLKQMKQFWQILEIVEMLFPEGEAEEALFMDVEAILRNLCAVKPSYVEIQEKLNQIMISLGYQDFHDTKYSTIGEYVSIVADRPLHSYDFLTVGEM